MKQIFFSVMFLCAFICRTTSGEERDLLIQMIDGHGGVPINVVQTGDAGKPSILFIHGNGQSYLSWTRQLESSLADDFHLVAYDLRGHGNSGKPWRIEDYNHACIWADDMDAVLAATGLVKPIVVAWSRGGLIAMHYISCRGTENLAGIVMVGSRGRLVTVALPSAGNPSRISQVQLETNDIVQNMTGAQTFARLMTVEPQDADWETLATAMNLMAPPYARRAMRAPVTGPDGEVVTSYAGLIDKIAVPFRVVLGEDDPLRDSQELADAYRAAMPTADILMYPNAGHSPFLESPDRFNADLRAFARRVFGK